MLVGSSRGVQHSGFLWRAWSRIILLAVIAVIVLSVTGAATVGQFASSALWAHIRELPTSFRTSQQTTDTQKAYAADPLAGKKVTPLDGTKLTPTP